MIDFINPHSKVSKYGLVLSLVSLIALGFGGFVTFDKFTEYHTAKQIANGSALPSGDYLLTIGLGQSSDVVQELLEDVQEIQVEQLGEVAEDLVEEIVNSEPVEEVVVLVEEDVVVAGVQYNEDTPKTQVPVVEKSEKIPEFNMIVIPKMGVRAVINEGTTADTLGKGVWRMPQTGTPLEGGNTVITAHRYLYRPPDPRTFFLIDKLVPGDNFYIYWEGERHDYKVRETKIIDPSEISILYNTPNNQITLFSCTPLFTSDKRLVVIADEL